MKEFFEKKKETVAAVILWLIVFSQYYTTLSPSVGFIDSGELATVAITLGIAHPTGYPLFTMLGRLFSILPIAGEEIVRLNLLSAVLTSLALVVFYYVITELLDRGKKEDRTSILISSFTASLFLGFSKTFWFQGVAVEVYSLHLLMICLILLLFVNAVRTNEARWWLLFSFSVGASFTNHLTTILLAPALLYWFFAEQGVNKNAFKNIAKLSIPFMAGLSIYLYLPIRSAQQPLLNWGDPQTFEKFWWHFTGKQFRVFMFSSTDAAKKQLNYFFENLPNEFFFVVLAFAVVGCFILLFTDKKKFVFTGLLFVSCIAYSINYDIHDIDSYFLLAFIAIAIFSAFGIQKIYLRFEKPITKSMVMILLIIIVSVQCIESRKKVNQSENYLVEDYTKNILLNLPQNSIVLSYQWDYFVASSYYYQYVKNIRKDVVVLDKELFRRSWYIPQLENHYPELMRKSKIEAQLFQQELFKFEHELPYDFAAIEGRYTALLKSFMDKNESLVFYITPEIEPQYTLGYYRVPEGFLFRIRKDTVYSSTPSQQIIYRGFDGKDIYSKQITTLALNALLRRELYERYYGMDSVAEFYRQKASEIKSKRTP
ncbi:MAG: DUF2723 domain-containing protein [Bacteroidota bacterium]